MLPLITVCILLIYSKTTSGQTAKEIHSNPYNFYLFENFELTKLVHRNESKIVTNLKLIVEILSEKEKTIQFILEGLKSKNSKIPAKKLADMKNGIFSQLAAIRELYNEFPNQVDYTGAANGLLRLAFNYEFNFTALSDLGLLEFIDAEGNKKSFSCHEKLTAIDYAMIATAAKEQNLIGTSIDLMKECLRLIPLEKDNAYKLEARRKKLAMKTKKDLVQLNNGYLMKKGKFQDAEMLLKPYLVDDNLEKKKKQPKFIKENKHHFTGTADKMVLEDYFAKVCRDGFMFWKRIKIGLKCRFLHHNDPYLKLGPFKEDQVSDRPYAVIFRDILSPPEIDFLIDYATPRLSRGRLNFLDHTPIEYEHEFKDGKKRKIVHKTVQAWVYEAVFPPESIPAENTPYVGKKYTKLELPNMWKLAKKIQLATQLKTDSQFSATPMQVTNYGLGGLCEAHIDPHGYLEGAYLPDSRKGLVNTGDMIGTFMAWLKDVEAGGGTAYLQNGYDGILMPEKGSAAFWYDLMANGQRDLSTIHGGCPVLKGSKWILNKWMYSFDNFQKFPCLAKKGDPIPAPDDSHYFK